MSVRMSSASWGREGTWVLHIHCHAQPAESGFCWDLFRISTLFPRRGRDRSTTFLSSMQRLNGKCLLQSGRMALQCIVRRALECEIRMLGKHVNFRVGLDFERGLDYEE